MIDIHCHILNNVDDGARGIEDSLAIAQEAIKQGINTIIATPHHRNNQFLNTKNDILEKVSYLNSIFQERKIPLSVIAGQEIRIYGEMLEGFNRDELLPLNSSRYVLVEFPTSSIPKYTNKLFYNLQLEGYIPVIAHPERNHKILDDPNVLYDLVANGALSQLTAASLCGRFGKRIKNLSENLIEANLVHFVASDAHNTTNRNITMDEAFNKIEDSFGRSVAYNYIENAELLIDDQMIIKDMPTKIKKKKFLGIF
ncbi:tyrosine-protein phosphatase [Terribacillus saccharophilus]|uniref:tyrosine-protein phosphatase n=1 Tax=Terribacillus saccharophilus TaxID=361277 RepID=UPI002989F3AB|nr:CpsB/CapC family capsule biosynthesis tyrosine phosphatase [Terribacillus saccharophilus]MCM3225249.1 tyrosine protein phosphatase [Terribacillus saccharophilus]